MADESSEYKQSRLFTTEDGDFDEARAKRDALPVENGDVVDTSELAEHQTYIDGRGVYDERNEVNDLTGREWKYATKSVVAEQYPPDFQHELRSEHGGQKPPRLAMELIQRFSEAGDSVLDPFAGVGGTLLGASLAEYSGTGLREAIGFEINERWVEIYETVLEEENAARKSRGRGILAAQDLRHGDCAELVEDLDTESIDLLLTDVPYWSMDKVEQTRNDEETRESKLDDFDDAEIQTKSEWLDDMERKFRSFRRVLNEGAYVAVFIGDMYREQSYNMLSADLADRITDAGYTMKATLIWYDPSKDLHVYGYPFSFVPSMVHQNILIFRTEQRPAFTQ
jgi:DNA modification methylase